MARSLGVGDIGGQFAVLDDGNPVWEDIDYDSNEEYEYESRWRENEKENGDAVVTTALDKKELEKAGVNHQRQFAKV